MPLHAGAPRPALGQCIQIGWRADFLCKGLALAERAMSTSCGWQHARRDGGGDTQGRTQEVRTGQLRPPSCCAKAGSTLCVTAPWRAGPVCRLAATTYYFSSLDDLIVKAVEHVGALEAQQLRERVAGLSRRRRGAEATVDVLVDLLVGDDPESQVSEQLISRYERYIACARQPRSARGPAADSAAADRRGRQGRRSVRPVGACRTRFCAGVRRRRGGGGGARRRRRRSARHRARDIDRRHRCARPDHVADLRAAAHCRSRLIAVTVSFLFAPLRVQCGWRWSMMGLLTAV